MPKKTIMVFVLFIAATCVYGGANDPMSDAKALFEQGKYKEGLDVLDLALRQYSSDPLLQVDIRRSLAEFYEDYVGNYDLALTQYKQILKAPLPADDSRRSLAEKEMSRLAALETEYRKQNALLMQLRSVTSRRQDEADIKEQIGRLETVIKANPKYYRLAEAYYYLGLNHMSLGKYGKACKAFDRCVQLKPSIDLYLPVTSQSDVSHGRWVDAVANAIVWGILGAILLFIVIMFYASRPWRWVKPRHVIGGLAMTVLWWGVFNISLKVLEKRVPFTGTVIEQIQMESPAFAIGSSESRGSELSRQLFLYGLVALWGGLLLAVGTSRFKHRWVTLTTTSILGLLLSACLTSVFYLRYCDNGVFNSQAKDGLYYPKGALYFRVQDPEPYVLTNPKAYPNLKADEMHVKNRYLREWIQRYCPFDHPDGEADQAQLE